MSDDRIGGPPGFPERMRLAYQADVTPRRAEARRLAQHLRTVIERLVATSAPVEELTRAADEIEALARSLEAHPRARLFDGFAESGPAGDPSSFLDASPIIGKANPIAPPVELAVVDGTIVGRARYGSAYEGPPGCVHGGHIAAAFDEVLGMTQSLGGQPGMTGTLTVRYRRPTPLHTDLEFEGVLERVEGRKIFTRGTLHAEGELRAEAEAIFISVDFDKLSALAAEREARQGER